MAFEHACLTSAEGLCRGFLGERLGAPAAVRCGLRTVSSMKQCVTVRTSSVRPCRKCVDFLTNVPQNRIVRHTVGRRTCVSAPTPTGGICSAVGGVLRKGFGRSIPRRRRLSLSENGNPFVRFADISPNRGISLCHFVTFPQRGAPLPYNRRFRSLFALTNNPRSIIETEKVTRDCEKK